jgi:hypothetical protein
MTQTTPFDEDTSPYPAEVLINVIVTLLAPMFIAAANPDIGRARVAALETITSYQARSHASLIKVANIIAFGLATLGSLSLSMGDEMAIPLILRLRSNANALDRSTDRNERGLKILQADAAAEAPGPGFDESDVYAGVAEAQQRAAEFHARTRAPAPRAEPARAPRDQQPAASAAIVVPRQEPSYRSQWAAAMAEVAAEEIAAAANRPPDQRKAHSVRAEILSSTANTLLCGGPGSPPVTGMPPEMVNPRTGQAARGLRYKVD